MTEVIKLIQEWTKRTEGIIDRDRYSLGLFVLVLAGFCLQVPLMLNIIIQTCFLVCSVHLIFRYFKAGAYLMALLKIGLIVAVGLVDDVYLHIIIQSV